MITSKANPKIKQARALRQRKERESTGLFLAEGIAHVGAAVETGAAIEYLLVAPDTLSSEFGKSVVRLARERGVVVEEVSDGVLEALADKDNPAGLLAVIRQPPTAYTDLVVASDAWYVALVAPQDPGNVGAVLRTIDAAGASGLILLDGGVDAFHPNAVRASLGAVFYRSVSEGGFEAFIGWARTQGCAIVGTSAKGAEDYARAAYPRPLVLVMGSEQKGLTSDQRAACDRVVQLPMAGRVSSLNLAVATGVLLYAIRASGTAGR